MSINSVDGLAESRIVVEGRAENSMDAKVVTDL